MSDFEQCLENKNSWNATIGYPADSKCASSASLSLGIPIRSTMDTQTTVHYAGLINSLTAKTRSTIREIDPTNDLQFVRVRTRKSEIMIAPGLFPMCSVERLEKTEKAPCSSFHLSCSFLKINRPDVEIRFDLIWFDFVCFHGLWVVFVVPCNFIT